MIVAFAVSLAVCFLMLWLGPRIGAVDMPDGSPLKAHDRPAVPLGGVGIFLGLQIALAMNGFDPWFLIASSIVLILGLIDDRRGVSPKARLLVEAAAALVLVIGTAEGDVLVMVLGFCLIIISINAVNLFDGLDGLAGSVSMLTALGLAQLSTMRGLDGLPALGLSAAVAGFLVLNWHPARLFMGDAGAYVVGLTLAYLMIESAATSPAPLALSSGTLGILAIDLLVTLVRRRRQGVPLFLGDRSHLYDQMHDRGWTVVSVVAAAALFQVIWVLGLLALESWFSALTGVIVMTLVAIPLVLVLGTRSVPKAPGAA